MPAPTMSTLGLFELSFPWGMLSGVGIVVMEWNEDEEIGTQIANTIQQKTSGTNLKQLCLTHFGRRSHGERSCKWIQNKVREPFDQLLPTTLLRRDTMAVYFTALYLFLWFL